MPHNPTLEAHEHAEHAEHAVHANDPFVSKVAITVALLAVLAAGATSLETIEGGTAIKASSEAVLAQEKATDSWNEYQADSLKKHMYGIAAKAGGPNADGFAKEAADQAAKQGGIRERAEENEHERDRLTGESAIHEHRHHWLTGAATLVEIGIALSTVAIITRRRTFWGGAALLGLAGVGMGVAAYLA